LEYITVDNLDMDERAAIPHRLFTRTHLWKGVKRKEHRKVGFVSQLVLNNPEYLSLFIVSDG
jgi:hypothetical protein